MTYRTITRAATAAVTTVAAGALTLLVTGTADAAPTPATINWANGADQFSRTISDSAPTSGETVTVSTTISTTSTNTEQFNWFKDWHPTCLSYVTGSATMTDNTGAHPVEPYLQTNVPTFIAGDFTSTPYKMDLSSSQSVTFSAQYTATGAGCGANGAINGGVEYLSSVGHSSFQNLVSLSLSPVAGAAVGQTSTLTATVAPTAPGGTVTFMDGNTVLGTGNVGADGTASTSWTPSFAGNHSISASYTAAAANTATATETVSVGAVGVSGSAGGAAGSAGGALQSILGGVSSAR